MDAEFKCFLKDDNYNDLTWLYISNDFLNTCAFKAEYVDIINFPLVQTYDESKFEIKSNYIQNDQVYDQTLTVKSSSFKNAGLYVCITGHIYSVKFHMFYLNVKNPYLFIDLESLNTRHLLMAVVAAIFFSLILFVILFIMTVKRNTNKKLLKSSKQNKHVSITVGTQDQTTANLINNPSLINFKDKLNNNYNSIGHVYESISYDFVGLNTNPIYMRPSKI